MFEADTELGNLYTSVRINVLRGINLVWLSARNETGGDQGEEVAFQVVAAAFDRKTGTG
jgi:hypothetical protein